MRDKDRLDEFFVEFRQIYKNSFPDWRFMQLMLNFMGWVQHTKGRDPFFPEEDECLKLFREYANTNSQWFRKN